MKTENANLGLFPFDCHPDVPAIFRHPGSATYVTDGRKVMGPYSDIPTADYELSMVLIERRVRWTTRIVAWSCGIGIGILVFLFANAQMMHK